jgi:hypothetical protein
MSEDHNDIKHVCFEYFKNMHKLWIFNFKVALLKPLGPKMGF